MKSDLKFWLDRAEKEAILAILGDRTDAGAFHYDLAMRYSDRARGLLVPRTEVSPPRPSTPIVAPEPMLAAA